MVLNNSLAAFRPPAQHHQDLAALAQTHFQNDLTQEDRDVLTSAGATLGRYATIGSLVGVGVGCLLAYRVRALRRNWFVEFQRTMGQDRPRRVVFESGKDCTFQTSRLVTFHRHFFPVAIRRWWESLIANIATIVEIPDITDKIAPSKVGDLAAYTLLGIGGLFLGGETGLLTGSAVASRRVQRDEARVRRVREAYRRFKVEALRKEADELEKGAAGEVIW